MSHHITVIYGSVRINRQGIKLARFITKECQKLNWETTLIDPLEYDLPLIDKMHKEYEKNEVPKNLQKLSEIIKAANGYIIVSAEYNHSLPPALTNLMDYFQSEYIGKPAGLAMYSAGPFAGVRVLSQLRSFVAELGMVSLPMTYQIPAIQDAFNDEGVPTDIKTQQRRINKFLDELDWYTNRLKNK